MKIGITGTREGMSEHQFEMVSQYLAGRYCEGAEFHHGDCSGVDVEAAYLARELGYKIVCYSPKSDETRGFFGGDVVHEPAGYLERDRAIVDACDYLLVVPLQMEWQPRGGTWYTHDYAVKQNKPFFVIYPK
jgi:hypothetical protein